MDPILELAHTLKLTLHSMNQENEDLSAVNITDALLEIAKAIYFVGRVIDEAHHDVP